MNRFKSLLTDINNRLTVPQPAKSRIILEIAADLESQYNHYLQQGHDEATASRLAMQKFAPDDLALAELESLHRSFFRRGLDKLSLQAQALWERLFLVFLLILITAAGMFTLLTTTSPVDLSPFTWPVGVIFCIALLISLHKFYILYIKKDHRVKRLRNRLMTILFLAGLILFISLFGYYFELYRFGNFAHILETRTIYILSQNHPQFFALLNQMTHWMIRSSLLSITSLLASIIIAFCWFVLNNKVARIERAEFESIIADI